MVTRNRVGAQAIDTVATTSNTNTQDPSKDNRVPSAPATLVATPPPVLGYAGGTYSTTVSLSWVLPIKAVDGTTMTPDHTEVYHLYGTGTGPFILATTVDVPDHTAVLRGYGVGSTWQFKVRVVSANNKKSLFSNTLQITMPTTPLFQPMPSPPETSSVGLMAQVLWDGHDQNGAAMPGDFDHLVVKRADDTNFTTNVYQVGALLNAGTFIDGPFDQNAIYYYRFFAVNGLGIAGPDSVSEPVVIAGVDGSDIQSGTINTLQLHEQLAADIQKAISSTESNAVPGNRIFGPSASPPTGSTSDPLLAGDLWFDSNNVPWRYSGSDTGAPNHGWVNVRDAVVDDAFKSVGGNIVLSQPYLLPDYVQTQFLKATLVSAHVLIADQTITTDIIAGHGLFGTMDAAVLNAGTISADRIAANSITTDKMLIADLTNFCNEPLFDNGGKSWTDPQSLLTAAGGTNAPVRLTVAANGGVPSMNADGVTVNHNDGWVYAATGIGGVGYTIANTRTLDVTEIDQFYGELWVRRTTSATTGKVTLALNVTCGPNNTVTTKPIGSYTFRTSDPVNKWFLITGFIQPPDPPKPPPTKQGGPGIPAWDPQCLPDGAFLARPVILMDATLIAGYKVQFTGARVQRKQHSQLVVDGSITASSLAAQTITGAEIAAGTVSADNIVTNTITATEIFSSGITGTSADISFITALLIRGETISTVGWDTVHKRPKWPGVTIDKTSMVYYDGNGAVYFKLDFATGAVTFNSGVDKTKPRYEITASGIRLYPTGTGAVPSVLLDATTGNASFSGDITGSNGTFYGDLTAGAKVPSPVISGGTHTGGTITGAMFQTSATNPRAWMNDGTIEVVDAKANIVFRVLADSTTTSGAVRIDTVTYPRFFLETNTTNGAMTFYDASKAIKFKLDFHTGGLTLAGPIVSDATITASVFQTAPGNPRIILDTSWFLMTDDQGNNVVRFIPGSTGTDASFLLDSGPDHYPRFTLNSTSGMYAYDASKQITFQILFTDGSIKMDGALLTTGTITGAAIRTGTTGARVTMDSTNGIVAYNSKGDQVFYANMSGTAYFKGTIDVSNINTPKLNGGTIASVTFGSGNSGGTFAGPTLNTPTLGGTSTNTGAFTGSGGTIVSGTGPDRIVIVSNQMQIWANGSVGGLVGAYENSNDVVIEGYGSGGQLWMGYNGSYGGGAFSIANGSGSSAPSMYAPALRLSPITAIAGFGQVYVSLSGASYMGVYTSSVRYKKAVQPLGLDPRFMDITTATWEDKPNRGTVAMRVSQPGISRRSTGFTAENLHRTGLTDTVSYDSHRRPQAVQQAAVLAHNVRYTQHLVRQVEELTARVAALEGAR